MRHVPRVEGEWIVQNQLQPRTRARRFLRPLMGIGAFAVMAWAMAGWISISSSPAHAEPTIQFRAIDTLIAVPFAGEWYTVSVEMLMRDDGSGSLSQEVATARAELVARFPGAVEITDGEVTAQFAVNGYWWPTKSAAWSYNPDGKPVGLGDEGGALGGGASAWTAGGFSFTGGGSTGAGTGACSGGGLDGTNTVGWAAQGGSVLAVTCSWFQGTGNPKTAIEFDIQIDPGWNWTVGNNPQVDLQSVLTHEFGHALGLGHSADSSAVMYPSYTTGTLKRSLAGDDIAGARAIYGAPPTPTPTASATASPTASPTPTGTPTPPPTPSPSATASPSPTASATASPTASPTVSATPTRTPRSVALLPGANLLTWPGQNAAPGQALAGQAFGLQAVYGWDSATQTWKRYLPGVPGFVNSLSTLQQGKAYWFLSTANSTVPYVP